MTIAEFCTLKGVCCNSFYQWRSKLNGSAAGNQTFVPVEIASLSLIAIELPDGATELNCLAFSNESGNVQPNGQRHVDRRSQYLLRHLVRYLRIMSFEGVCASCLRES